MACDSCLLYLREGEPRLLIEGPLVLGHRLMALI